MAKASAAPTIAPEPAICTLWARNFAAAALSDGGGDWVTANANSAFSTKAAMVRPATTRPIGIRIGPRIAWNDLPWSTWNLRSSIASQIHIAGRICTSISRQFVTTSRSPLNSSTNALTAKASGAKARCDPLSRRTARSIEASSLSSIARTSAATRRASTPGAFTG
ncbi:MAG: hypothetical protein ACTHMY_28535 [Solirubrobacteraceae bacterium]